MTNNPFQGILCNQTKCPNIVNWKHVEVAQRGPRFAQDKSRHTLDELHAYPEKLVKVVFQHVSESTTAVRPNVGPEMPKPKILPFDQTKASSAFGESKLEALARMGSSSSGPVDKVKADCGRDRTKRKLYSQKTTNVRSKKRSTDGPIGDRGGIVRVLKPANRLKD